MKSLLPLSLLIQPDKNDPRPLVIYHGRHCPDGFAAALAAWLFYEGQAEFLGLDHGDIKSVADLPELAGRAVYILDFSFSKELMQAIEAQAAKLVMLDHHRSAAEKLDGFACRCGVVHFDMKKSGARLAWDFFLPEVALPDLVRHVEDRDFTAQHMRVTYQRSLMKVILRSNCSQHNFRASLTLVIHSPTARFFIRSRGGGHELQMRHERAGVDKLIAQL